MSSDAPVLVKGAWYYNEKVNTVRDLDYGDGCLFGDPYDAWEETRPILTYVSDENEIDYTLSSLGVDPDAAADITALWVEIVDGDYGLIFGSDSNRPYDLSARAFLISDGYCKAPDFRPVDDFYPPAF